MVGMSGAAATRFGVVTPSTRTLPSLICCSAGCRSTIMKGMWPAITSSIAGMRKGGDRDLRRGCRHLGAEMRGAADPGRAEGEARIGLGIGDELGEILRWNLRVDDQRERHGCNQRDWRKILHGIIGQLLVQ